ncbi:MAG: type II toxin-antitoxin system VapC family toxin [Pseudomonadales bacterium]|nr:type II toxin-antitoxin system VapC family toxin [Pseudomonadales bacterium]
MTVVLDASVVAVALTRHDERSTWARTVMADERLFAPDVLPVEVTQVLRKLERSRQISTQQADSAFRYLLELDVQMISFSMLAPRIWHLRHNFTSYDAAYIATAEITKAPLATLDFKMANQPADCDLLTPP